MPRSLPETQGRVQERRRPEFKDLREAMDHLQEIYRQDWAQRTGRRTPTRTTLAAQLQAAKNRVLAVRLKHRM